RPPNRLESGWAHGAILHHAVESVEMFLFLRRHALDRLYILSGARISNQHGELTFIDTKRAELAGMIDPDHGIDFGGKRFLCARKHRTRAPHFRLKLRT